MTTKTPEDLTLEFCQKYHRGDFYFPEKDKKWDNSVAIADYWLAILNEREQTLRKEIEKLNSIEGLYDGSADTDHIEGHRNAIKLVLALLSNKENGG